MWKWSWCCLLGGVCIVSGLGSFLPNDPANIAAPVLESYKDQIGIESIDSAQ
ncbi:unnamed protein product [Brugia timori]|uniref:Neur_chan_LBD domain-containing protein n=1 Tax=Brugia timori TaxID=42155 RepID=A0A0R3QNS5_9BILA|nr:unnamed protein product [Brugia timori]